MNNLIKRAYIVIIALFFCFGCATTSNNTNVVLLDDALKMSAVELTDSYSSNITIAVINFKSPSEELSSYVIEELIGYLVQQKKLTVVDRNSLELIKSEINFQYSGDVSDESAQAIGKMLGAKSIVTGGITAVGTNYRLRIYSLNVETGVRESVSMFTINKSEVANFKVENTDKTEKTVSGILDGVWVGYFDYDDQSQWIVTIKGNEGTLEELYDNRISRAAKGNIMIDGNYIFGRATHIWNGWNGWMGMEGPEQWETVNRVAYLYSDGDVHDANEFIASYCQVTGTISGNTMTINWADQVLYFRKR
jgi:TolB-like protein